MSISDPAQLLQRAPELETLTGDTKIRRAIESGDPFKVYRALVLARLFRRLPQHKALLDALTSERRLFFKPLKRTPSLMSMNSVGFGFVGKAEKNSDDSYIALHAVVVLFVVPLIPLGAYIVKDTGTREYQIYARAPLGILGWLYTRGVALALVVSVLLGAAHGYQASGTQDLTVLNGFDVALTVDIGHQLITVPANGRSTVKLKTGKVQGSARAAKGGVLDTFDEKVDRSGRLSIWNIAGAAPLVRNTVVYSVHPKPGDGRNAQMVYCGQRFVEIADVKYRFTEPPSSMSMSKHQDSVSVEQVDVVAMPARPGVLSCIDYARGHGKERDIARAMEAVAQLNDWSYGHAASAAFFARSVSPAEAVRVAQRAVQGNPGDVRVARLLQHIRDAAGEHEAMLREHAERARQHPDSAAEQYLYASLTSGKAGLAELKAKARKFPLDGPILRSLAWRKLAHGDYQGAARDIVRLHQISEVDADLVFDVEIKALLALQRGKDALALLDAAVRDEGNPGRPNHAAEFALVARQLGADPERFLKTYPGSEQNALALDFLRARAGLSLLQADSTNDPQIQLVLALRDAPVQAVKIAGGLRQAHFLNLATDQLALLYGEAVRTGQAGLIASIGASMHLGKAEEGRLRQFVRGEAVSLDEVDLDPEVQAVAYFIRSRNAQLPAAERAALRNSASKSDLLHGAVTAALRQWPEES